MGHRIPMDFCLPLWVAGGNQSGQCWRTENPSPLYASYQERATLSDQGKAKSSQNMYLYTVQKIYAISNGQADASLLNLGKYCLI